MILKLDTYRVSDSILEDLILDDDVKREQMFARESYDKSFIDQQSVLIAKDLAKTFGFWNPYRAVRGLSFTVKQGDNCILPNFLQCNTLYESVSESYSIESYKNFTLQ